MGSVLAALCARHKAVTTFRLRKWLTAQPPAHMTFPEGIALRPFLPERHARAARALLNDSYADGAGQVAAFEDWWPALQADSEYDPALCFAVEDEAGALVAFAQCWTSGFVKDIAVASGHRRRGIGRALLEEIARIFFARVEPYLDLKVVAGNAGAIAFYQSLRFVVVEEA